MLSVTLTVGRLTAWKRLLFKPSFGAQSAMTRDAGWLFAPRFFIFVCVRVLGAHVAGPSSLTACVVSRLPPKGPLTVCLFFLLLFFPQ